MSVITAKSAAKLGHADTTSVSRKSSIGLTGNWTRKLTRRSFKLLMLKLRTTGLATRVLVLVIVSEVLVLVLVTQVLVNITAWPAPIELH